MVTSECVQLSVSLATESKGTITKHYSIVQQLPCRVCHCRMGDPGDIFHTQRAAKMVSCEKEEGELLITQNY